MTEREWPKHGDRMMTTGEWMRETWREADRARVQAMAERAEQREKDWLRIRDLLLDPNGIQGVMVHDGNGNIIGGML